jgi:hypothetical protein
MTLHYKTNTDLTNNELLISLQDYMFTSRNLIRFSKHMIQNQRRTNITKYCRTNINERQNSQLTNNNTPSTSNKPTTNKNKNPFLNNIYKPIQKDSLFWCFYILKNGYSNYEMEINNQYFVVEKTQKFKYIERLRKNKDLLKIHKIKPYTEIEDDLANKDKISIKTFFALCILENINILLVDKRKIYELICVDIDNENPVHVIHRNSQTLEHHIELNNTPEKLNHYRETYYKMNGFGETLKSIGSYKTEELLDLCNKLNITITSTQKKTTKKYLYEQLILNY